MTGMVLTPNKGTYPDVVESGTIVTHMANCFAARLNTLYDRWELAHERPLHNREVAARIAAAGHRVSHAYLSQLRSGSREYPSSAVVDALADLFGVDPYYLHGLDGGTGNMATVSEFRDPGLRRLACAAAGLSDTSQRLLISVADKLRLAEGLGCTIVDL